MKEDIIAVIIAKRKLASEKIQVQACVYNWGNLLFCVHLIKLKNAYNLQ